MSAEPPVHLFRRLGAICYDALLLLAVLFVAGLPLPLIPEAIRDQPWVRHATLAYMLLMSFVFFAWFWTHGGQTLGMRAWGIRVLTDDRQALTWRLAWRRFVWAMFSWAAAGLGFLWSLFDPQRRAWHDRLSHTRLVRTGRRSLAPQQNHAEPQEQQRR